MWRRGLVWRTGGALGFEESECILLTNNTKNELWYGIYFTRTEGSGTIKSSKVSVAETRLKKILTNTPTTIVRPKYKGLLTRGDRELMVISVSVNGLFTRVMWKSLSGPDNIFEIEQDSIKSFPKAKSDTDKTAMCQALLKSAKSGGQAAMRGRAIMGGGIRYDYSAPPRMLFSPPMPRMPPMYFRHAAPQGFFRRPPNVSRVAGAGNCAYAIHLAPEAEKSGVHPYVGLYNTKSGSNSTTVSQLLRDKSGAADTMTYRGGVFIDKGEASGFFSRQDRDLYVFFEMPVQGDERNVPKIIRKTISPSDNHFMVHDNFAISYEAPTNCP